MNILLIEDNKTIAKGVTYSLSSNGYACDTCFTCEEAYRKIGEAYAVIIIDISLPDGNGFELYRELKRINSAPVIFLTALDDEDSVVNGFELGAEDYVTKPFSTRELIARIKRLTKGQTDKIICAPNSVTINLSDRSIKKDGENVELTALESKILLALARNAGITVTRELILEQIWDAAGNYVNDNTLSVYIKRIRAKLGGDIIKTVKGVGYRLENI